MAQKGGGIVVNEKTNLLEVQDSLINVTPEHIQVTPGWPEKSVFIKRSNATTPHEGVTDYDVILQKISVDLFSLYQNIE